MPPPVALLSGAPFGARAEYARSYFGARYYRADVGRFTGVDPLMEPHIALFDPQRWNRYAYVGNRPLRLVDPDGRGWASALFKVGKAVVKGGSIASEFYGIVDDVRTVLSEDASLGQRAWAVASLASEVISPVSVRDAKGAMSFAVRHTDVIEPVVEFTGRRSIRKGLEELSDVTVAGAHAHHMLPAQFGETFWKRWGGQWERWLDEHQNASFDEALNFGRQLARDYGLAIYF